MEVIFTQATALYCKKKSQNSSLMQIDYNIIDFYVQLLNRLNL